METRKSKLETRSAQIPCFRPKACSCIGHFHVGDVPGRHEPGTGEINYRNVFKAIYELGDRYQGYVALEYGHLAPLEQNLADVRKLSNFA